MKEPYPYSHHVSKTRKDHKCAYCSEIISKGSKANYKNLFTGKRGYIHFPECPRDVEYRLVQLIKEHGQTSLGEFLKVHESMEQERGHYVCFGCKFSKLCFLIPGLEPYIGMFVKQDNTTRTMSLSEYLGINIH